MRLRKKPGIKSELMVEQPKMPQQTNSLNPLDSQYLRTVFAKCPDIQFSPSNFNDYSVTFIYCSGLINTDLLFNTVPALIEKFTYDFNGILSKDSILEGLNLPSLTAIYNVDDATINIFAGKLLIDFGIQGTIFTVDISKRPERKPSDTKAESTVLGPRDDFIEDIQVNISLIRKRLRTTSFVFEEFTIGTRTRTKVSLLYIEDIVNNDTLNQIRTKLSSISIDGLSSGNQLEELINPYPFTFFPRHKYTGKPDFAVQTLINGRFVILIDGVATAYITPVNFHILFKTSEDREISYIYSSLERLLRVTGLLMATILPGVWISLTTFHQDQLPIALLATVVETRMGVPFPAPLEAFGMLLLFDLFREAGVRLPMAIGQILSVVGGLIIGDAAINSGLTSPAMLVIIALSTVATFTLIDQSLVGTISIIRIASLMMATILGFFGVLLSFFLLLCYLGNIKIFGVSYIDGINQFNFGTFLKTFFRLPASQMKSRPEDLNLNDVTKKGE